MKQDYRRILIDLSKTSKLKKSYWATEEEAKILVDRIEQSKAHVYIESGTCHGFTSCWAATTQILEVHTFDPAIREKLWNRSNLIELAPKIKFYNQKFEEGFPKCVENLSRIAPLFFFIDGNHSLGGVSKDFNILRSHLRPGDRLMFHDSITEHNVNKFTGRIQREFPRWTRTDFITDRGITEFQIV